ncbi:HERC1, partial [Symbiodinium sp. CCMP2456]
VPATTLQSLANTVSIEQPSSLGPQRSTDATANAFRTASRFVKRWGLQWKIPISTYEHSDDVHIPFLAPRDILSHMIGKCPELLFGGYKTRDKIRELLSNFWCSYRAWHPSHEVFREARDGDLNLHYTLPILIHGDEGRGVRKGNVAVCSMETPFGLATHTEDRSCEWPCCDPNNKDTTPCAWQTVNLQFHSFLTKYLLFLMPNKIYKQEGVLAGLLRAVFLQLRCLFFEGIQIGQQIWHVAVIGCKGDMAWFLKLADLDRSFARLSKKQDQMCCHECLAGCTAMPFEDLSDDPGWAPSVYTQRPWLQEPASGLCLIPYDVACPESILRRDIFHNLKVGVLQDFIAGSLVVIANFGYFHEGANHINNSIVTVLSRMHGHFKLWCAAMGKSPSLQGFTKQFLNIPTKKHYGWSKSKGNDSVLLVQWLLVLTKACERDLRREDDRGMLEAIYTAASAANDWLKHMYAHSLWWSQDCAKKSLELGTKFIRTYGFLAYTSLHKYKLSTYAIKPKLHMLHHSTHSLRCDLRRNLKQIPSLLLSNCEMNEDFIGRICRTARKMHQRNVCQRVLEMYLIKGYALHKRFLKGPGLHARKKRKHS